MGVKYMKKVVVVGIILLFISVGIQPAFAVTSETIDNDDNCNLCPNISQKHIDRFKISQQFFKIILNLKDRKKDIRINEPPLKFCNLLINIVYSLADFTDLLGRLDYNFVSFILQIPMWLTMIIWLLVGCYFWDPYILV
jgi:hypothetical protein